MAKIIADRVVEASTTVGTGAYTLAGALLGFRSASSVCANGDTFDYFAEQIDGNGLLTGDWETGLGTWGTGGFLTRTTIYASSNAGSAVSWSSGSKRVSLAITAATIGSLMVANFGNVDNTSDINKPVSTAQAAADTATLNSAKSYAESLVVGLWDDRGNYNASVNTFPASGGSGAAGAVLKGDIWTISVAGALGGVPVANRQTVRALIDTPAQTSANWVIGLANTDIDDSITSGVTGRAPSQNAVFAALANKAPATAATGVLKGQAGALVAAVAGTDFTTPSSTETQTNKRVTARVGSAASSATPAINTDLYDIYKLTAQAVDVTSFTTNLTGTPVDGDCLIIEITGTAARAIAWGAKFEASTVSLPTTTVTTAMLAVAFLWNPVTSKWRCVAAV